MDCPACRKPLLVVEREGIELDFCPTCRGLWFDTGEMALLAERAGRALRLEKSGATGTPGGGAHPRRCPRCDRKMEAVRLGSAPAVEADRCGAGHGYWFDRGEIGFVMRQMPAKSGSAPEALLHFVGEALGPGAAVPGRTPVTNVSRDGEENR
jgi:hypothetical protein